MTIPAIPHIILFADPFYQGAHKHVFDTQNIMDFNDKVSSFVILEGQWQFFVDSNFQGQMGHGGGKTLGPGHYSNIDAALGGGVNDKLSSLKCVS